MREKRYSKDMKGTEGRRGRKLSLLFLLKENLLFNKTKKQ